MKQKPNKTLIDFHVKLRVSQDSVEAKIYEYLSDDSATPYSRSKLIIDALTAFYLPLVAEYHGSSQEQLEKALIDANYLWQLHFWYLQKSLGIDSPLSTFSHPSITPESHTSSSPFPNFQELAQQYTKQIPEPLPSSPLPHPNITPLPSPEIPSPEIEQSNSVVIEEEEEEGVYPEVF